MVQYYSVIVTHQILFKCQHRFFFLTVLRCVSGGFPSRHVHLSTCSRTKLPFVAWTTQSLAYQEGNT